MKIKPKARRFTDYPLWYIDVHKFPGSIIVDWNKDTKWWTVYDKSTRNMYSWKKLTKKRFNKVMLKAILNKHNWVEEYSKHKIMYELDD